MNTADITIAPDAVVAAGWTIGGEELDGHRFGGVEITD
jgi:hypothetical protein